MAEKKSVNAAKAVKNFTGGILPALLCRSLRGFRDGFRIRTMHFGQDDIGNIVGLC